MSTAPTEVEDVPFIPSPGPTLGQAAVVEACEGLEEGRLALCEFIAPVLPGDVLARWIATILPAAVTIVGILLAAWLLNRLVRRGIRKFVTGLAEQGIERFASRGKGPLAATKPVNLQRATMRTETIGGVLRSLATAAIWTIAVLMILGEFGVSLGPLIAGAGIVGIALGFGSQKLVQDFLSGIFMILEDQFGVGDFIDVGDAVGAVEAVGLRTTRIRDIRGTVWHVPNGTIARVGNLSQEWSRALLDIGVAYGTDVDHASAVIGRVAQELAEEEDWRSMFVEAPSVWGVQELADSAILIRLVMKVVPAQQWKVEREMRRRLKIAFDAEGIEIPFPQRTVWHRHDNGSAPDGRAADAPGARDATGAAGAGTGRGSADAPEGPAADGGGETSGDRTEAVEGRWGPPSSR
jgi:moderate conductance mechanosensitive channel